jgi:hypothetical protein
MDRHSKELGEGPPEVVLDYISRILRCEGANPIISTMFYKAVVQTVLLFGSETWVMTPRILMKLESFHQLVAHLLTGRALVYLRWEEQLQHSSFGDTMEVVGVLPIKEYITHRRNKICRVRCDTPTW